MLLKKDVYNAKIKDIEDKLPDIIKLATNTTPNAKLNEIKNEMHSITNLTTNTTFNAKTKWVKKILNINNFATTTALTAFENKIPNVSNLVKKTGYKTKISEIENTIITDHDHDKYITIQDFNKLTSENFTVRLKQVNFQSKNDIANFIKKTDFDIKLKNVTSNKIELNELSKNVKAVSTEGSTKCLINKFSILNGAKYFSFGIFQNYLSLIKVSIPAKKYIKYFSGAT